MRIAYQFSVAGSSFYTQFRSAEFFCFVAEFFCLIGTIIGETRKITTYFCNIFTIYSGFGNAIVYHTKRITQTSHILTLLEFAIHKGMRSVNMDNIRFVTLSKFFFSIQDAMHSMMYSKHRRSASRILTSCNSSHI